MLIFKCKMCGGNLEIQEGMTVCECEYCGTKQTVPVADNEKKMNLFSRANSLRFGNEFDKAAGIYESIIAEFPQEAEAYWGLCLCTYGIEYVDDPKTGKKIPTCHRTSYTSIFDDANYSMAQQYSDTLASGVYQSEAKEIERLQRAILEIANQEEPFDIFICYKETEEDGQRTKDSVMAQDIYDALTDKGYKVFFARITLEDKLGQEFEPYIFSALNSAKVMLAIGTSFEHFNAVWVKNEWSRYLEMKQADKSKTLIPCYADIDAYDMPPEFRNLQGQDMGKVGFIQDLIRGMDKIFGRTKSAPQSVMTSASQNVNATVFATLQRALMCLEDGNFDKARDNFDKVLDTEPECAEAHWGMVLIHNQCRNTAEFVKAQLRKMPEKGFEKLKAKPDEELLAVQKRCEEIYTVPNYLLTNTIRDLFQFDFVYESRVSRMQEFYNQEKQYLAADNDVVRALKYAKGEFAEELEHAKNEILGKAEEALENAKRKAQSDETGILLAYKDHVKAAEEKAKDLFTKATMKRESDYASACQKMETADNEVSFKSAADAFEKLGDYQESVSKRQECLQRAEQLRGEREARETEERRLLAEKKARQAAILKRNIIIAAAAAAVLIVAVLVVTKIIIPKNQYDKALACINSGDYETGIAALEKMGDYRNAKELVKENKYAYATELLGQKKYGEAYDLFDALGDYEDSEIKKAETQNEKIKEYIENDKFDDGMKILEQEIKEGRFDENAQAGLVGTIETLIEQGKLDWANELIEKIPNYKDVSRIQDMLALREVEIALDNNELSEANSLLKKLEFENEQKNLLEKRYNYMKAKELEGKGVKAVVEYALAAGDFEDAKTLVENNADEAFVIFLKNGQLQEAIEVADYVKNIENKDLIVGKCKNLQEYAGEWSAKGTVDEKYIYSGSQPSFQDTSSAVISFNVVPKIDIDTQEITVEIEILSQSYDIGINDCIAGGTYLFSEKTATATYNSMKGTTSRTECNIDFIKKEIKTSKKLVNMGGTTETYTMNATISKEN